MLVDLVEGGREGIIVGCKGRVIRYVFEDGCGCRVGIDNTLGYYYDIGVENKIDIYF